MKCRSLGKNLQVIDQNALHVFVAYFIVHLMFVHDVLAPHGLFHNFPELLLVETVQNDLLYLLFVSFDPRDLEGGLGLSKP